MPLHVQLHIAIGALAPPSLAPSPIMLASTPASPPPPDTGTHVAVAFARPSLQLMLQPPQFFGSLV
jgi:hypothetical protein